LHVTELGGRFARKDIDQIINVFDIGTLIGYSARLSKETLIRELEHPNVRYIEADQVVTINDETVVQQGATWGIDRIDQRELPLNQQYAHWASGGFGVVAYIIDTGIQIAHKEFEGRAKWGSNQVPSEGETDGNGHGTHVAGTIGGAVYGIAKKVTLVAVKVLSAGGSGTWAGVVAGIDWVTKDHVARGAGALSVANMSLGGGATATVDVAVEQSVAAGVNHIVAAGNSADNACYYSPARVPGAITVGSTNSIDARSYFSNVGTCGDIFAPGEAITSAWIGASNDAINTISGTSMASPHVAGAIASYLGHLVDIKEPVLPTPVDVDLEIKRLSTKNIIADPGTGSPNSFLYSPSGDV